MAQSWNDLLFAHWPLPAERLRALLPPGLALDTFDGQAWLSVVPFHMSGVRARAMPALPRLGAFAELNVRTYVTRDGRPGVFFFSLDASELLAVAAARRFYHLPYFNARIAVRARERAVQYASERIHPGARPARFRAEYCPRGPVAPARAGTLDEWLTARYCLYAARRDGTLYRAEIDHHPWPLQPAEAEIRENGLASVWGLTLPVRPPLLHFSRRLDVRVWPLRRLSP